MIFYTYESSLGTGCRTHRGLQNLQPHNKRNIKKLLHRVCSCSFSVTLPYLPSGTRSFICCLIVAQIPLRIELMGTAEELTVIRHHHGPRSISSKSWLIMRLIDEQWCAQPQLNMFIQSSNVLRQIKVSDGFAVDYVLVGPSHFHVDNCKSTDH